MVEFSIETYEPRHAVATARLWLDSFHSIGLSTGEGGSLPETVARVEQDSATVWEAWLAWEGSRLVGFLALKREEACLDQIFLAPEAKFAGRGVRLLDFAKSRLPAGLWLRAAADNAVARRFYEKHGLWLELEEPHPKFGHPTAVYRWP